MKFGGLWKFGFLRPRARDAARNADASVGEWLNSVVQSSDDEGSTEASRRRKPPTRQVPLRRDNGSPDRPHIEGEEAGRETARDKARLGLGEAHARLDQLAQHLDRLAQTQAARQRAAIDRDNEPVGEHRPPLSGPAPQRLRSKPEPVLSIEDAVAEITERQRALDNEATEPAPPTVPEPEDHEAEAAIGRMDEPALPGFDLAPDRTTAASAPPTAPALAVDFSGLEAQLRQITTRIESLQPASDLEKAIAAIRTDLADISRQLGEALPRHAVESLEIEVKALGDRIDHTRQSGVDLDALAGLERGLAEVRDALRSLTPAENLVGLDEPLKALAQKVDMILARDDPSALQQLETAIGGLRGVVSHVASNDTLTKVADDVRALASQVDSLAINTATGQAVSALEQRVDTLAAALNASSEAGQAVPRDLEKLLGGLIEKLEWVQLTHTDHAALAHLEDRIATLVQRFDASDARLGHLEAIERGLADLLVHIDEIRGTSGAAAGATLAPQAVHAVERDVAEIRQNDRRTQDSLEAVAGTVEHLVDRLATIESDLHRDDTTRGEATGEKWAHEPEPAPAPRESAPAEEDSVDTSGSLPAPDSGPEETPAPRGTPARRPIDPTLPPNHPLEPGSAAPRSRPLSAAERIAESEAAIGAKPPIISDSERPNFIAAARRAAQAAAWETAGQKPKGAISASQTPAPANKLSERLRKLIVAGSVVLILLGCLRIATRMFSEGNSGTPPQTRSDQATPPAAPPQASTPPKQQPSTPPASPNPNPPPSTPPSATPPSAGKPDRQSMSHPDNQTAERVPTPSRGGVPAAPAMPSWAAPDITGALPPLATAPIGRPDQVAPIAEDKLPATIGDEALRKAAMAGDPAAAYEVAARFAEGRGVGQNNEAAAYWLRRAAKQGLAPAQFRLGGLYEKGLGVKKDLAAARDLYLAAAEKGNGKAMHNLAVLYAEGVDGVPDYGKAAFWFRKAADHGIRDSQYNLGILCARGIGVKQNEAESYKWFALAAKQGDQDAAKKRDEIASHLDAQSLAAARLAVQRWTPEPQPDDAINVKTAAAWEATAQVSGAPKAQ